MSIDMNASKEVTRVDMITPKQLKLGYISKNQPVVIENMMEHWSALNKWTPEYFKVLGADKTVYLEVGNVMQEQTQVREEKLAAYIDRIFERGAQSNETSKNTEETASEEKAYLSVFHIFKAFPDLKNDVDFSLLSNQTLFNIIYAWFGPAGTVTGYHIDWADNILAQIYGRKLIRLISPDQSQYMYPSTKYDLGSTLSLVDADVDYEKDYPLFAKTHAIETVLKPGEMLFIPNGWWHYIHSLEPSISVNNFGISLKGLVIDGSRELLKNLLHKVGLYGRECTCHVTVNGKRVKHGTTLW